MRPKLMCIRCGKKPDELTEYVVAALEEGTTPDGYVWSEEGTLNRENGHFLCSQCYIAAGSPTSKEGWKAP